MPQLFYVTVSRKREFDPVTIAILAGPLYSKEDAEGFVPAARKLAIDADPWAAFCGFGVTMLEPARQPAPRGVFNSQLGIKNP